MKKYAAIIMAAGEGKRMNSPIPKTAHKVLGKPMINWVIEAASNSGAQEIVTVIGFKGQELKDMLGDDLCKFAWQHEMKGTGHATMMAMPEVSADVTDVVVLCGDNPLITAETLSKMMAVHEQDGNSVTVLTAEVPDATGLGRVVRNSDGTFKEIREHKDATPEILEIREINASVYCFNREALDNALPRISNDNAQHEYYLPDALKIILTDGGKVGIYMSEDYTETLGINTPEQLATAEGIMSKR